MTRATLGPKRVSNSKYGIIALIPQPLLPEGEGEQRCLYRFSLSLRERVGVRGILHHATMGRDWLLDTL
jgi:hypothetical protein